MAMGESETGNLIERKVEGTAVDGATTAKSVRSNG